MKFSEWLQIIIVRPYA